MEIDIKPIGNLGNRMIQYLAARRLQEEFPESHILRANLPEFNIKNRVTDKDDVAKCLTIKPDTGMSFLTVVEMIRIDAYEKVLIQDHMQRIDWFPDRIRSLSFFAFKEDYIKVSPDQLLINIRAAEIVLGIGHYPLVPIDFFEKIVEQTGLIPVFMGQIGQNAYCQALRKRFPGASFIPSQGALSDFQTILSASNIVISVSTFSWLAAWLSNARQIFVPMLGFLNPSHFPTKIIDLLPSSDPRFRFFIFPLHFGTPELQDLPYHSELTRHCREISHRQVEFLRTSAPIIEADPFAGDFDGRWYCHNYVEAAQEIAEGWFRGPGEHFFEIGRRRGYRPLPECFSFTEPDGAEGMVDHAIGKRATQSSVSQWSIGQTVEDDAERAVCGIVQDPYAFHTILEMSPWWEVDLGSILEVHYVIISNRCETEVIAGRSTPLSAYASKDDHSEWELLFTTPDGFIFGRDGKKLTWQSPTPFEARRIRLTVRRSTFLHLRQVKICGPTREK